MIVADSSILIDYLRGKEAARDPVGEALAGEAGGILASELTRVELLSGMRSAERGQVRHLLSLLSWAPVKREIAERAGALSRQYRRSHQGIELADFVIAATAELREAELWTTNVRHFPMFEDLAPPY